MAAGGEQTFLSAERLAKRLNPDAAERYRPEAIILDALRSLALGFNREKIGTGHTLPKLPDIAEQARLDFALPLDRSPWRCRTPAKKWRRPAPISNLVSLEETASPVYLRQFDGVPFYVEIQSVIRPSERYRDQEVAEVLNLETVKPQSLIINKVARL